MCFSVCHSVKEMISKVCHEGLGLHTQDLSIGNGPFKAWPEQSHSKVTAVPNRWQLLDRHMTVAVPISI